MDDVPANLDVLLERLKDLSRILQVATSAEVAMEWLFQRTVDLVPLDLFMSGIRA